jgi:hypothetical protein
MAWGPRSERNIGADERLIAVAVGVRMSISRGGKSTARCSLSVGFSTGSTKKLLRSSARGGRLPNEHKIPVRPSTIRENGIIPASARGHRCKVNVALS